MTKLLNYRILKKVIDKQSYILPVRCYSVASQNSSEKPHYDVIIAGGGLVGLSLAAALGKQLLFNQFSSSYFTNIISIAAKNSVLAEKRILLLEGAPPFKPASRDKYSNRVSAINKQSVNLLKSVGAWDHVEAVRYKPVMQMQVWDAVSDEKIDFSHDIPGESVACIVENDLILEGLHKQLEALENVTVQNSSSLIDCDLKKDGLAKNNVKLKTGEEMSCDLLVS